jgi:hypothetical protein
VEPHDAPPGQAFELPVVPVSDEEADDGSDLLGTDPDKAHVMTGDGPFQAFGVSGGPFT